MGNVLIDCIKLTSELVKCPSISPDEAGSYKILISELNKIGFSCEVIEFKGDNSYPVKNLYAEFGEGSKTLGFAGHVDVVPPGDIKSWSREPFSGDIDETFVHGRGSEDMKSGIGAFVSAIAKFVSERPKFDGKIVLLITADEETYAVNGTKKLIAWVNKERGVKIDACLLPEPTSNKQSGDVIQIGRRGSLSFTVHVRGKQGHVAYNDLFLNPVDALSEIILKLKSYQFDSGNDDFASTNLEVVSLYTSSDTYNIVPEVASAKCNIRFNNLQTVNGLKTIVSDLVSNFKDFLVDIEFRDNPSEVFFIDPRETLVRDLQRIIKDELSIEASLNTSGGASDAVFISKYAPVVEIGVPSKTLHQIDERVRISDIYDLSRIFYAFMRDFFK